MLQHLGLMQSASMIENALLYTLESGVHTGDFGEKGTPAKNTTDFAQAIIANFGKKPVHSHTPGAPLEDHLTTCSVYHLDHNPMLESVENAQEKIMGVDIFIESNLQPEELAEKCQRHGGVKYKLLNISNRGTQVWPTGSVYTNLVNQYNIRFESTDDTSLSQNDIIGLYASLCGEFKVCSLELLNSWGSKKGYSLAQGQ